jgi:hypothetical protein
MGVFSRLMGQAQSLTRRPPRGFRGPRRRAAGGLGCEELERRLVMSSSPTMGGMDDMTAVLNLVPNSAVTNTAVHSGNWSSPSTWSGGVVPGAGANVLIPKGVTVTVDSTFTAALHTIRDDGILQFSLASNSGLLVDTLVVTMDGTLLMGTANAPILAGVSATLTFADEGPIDRTWDPLGISRGLISMGTVSISGAATTPYVALAQPAHAGDTTLILATVPVNWHVGDQLVLTGTSATQDQDEQLQILGILGNVVTVSPLAYNHVPPAAGLSVYVADLTRNVDLESQNTTDFTRAGHVMFMMTEHESISYAAFCNLGRTDKSQPVNDPMLDANGNLMPGTGTNPRGRYAMHFHHDGINDPKHPIMVTGNVVMNSPGWGYVNHDSNVDFVNNVAYNVFGAAFVTESGDEIGAFRGNLAIRSQGSGQGPGARANIQDFGHNGVGFWFQGPGVAVENNIAVGQAFAGFFYYTQGLTGDGMTTRFLASNLPNPAWANGQKEIPIGSVPIWDFNGNVVFASSDGLDVWYNLYLPNNPNLESVVQNFTAWGLTSNGVQINYSGQLTLQNVWALGNLQNPIASAAITGNNNYFLDIAYINVRVEGWAIGIQAPGRGAHNVIQGGYFNNIKNIDIVAESPIQSTDRVITIQGNPQFGTLPGVPQQFNVYLEPQTLRPLRQDITLLFRPEHNLLNTVVYNGKQVYYLEQAANFVPFPVGQAPPYVPAQLIGLTNQQLWQQYGLAVNGAVAPPDAVFDPTFHGLVGSPVTYPPELTLDSAKYTNRLKGYQLIYTDANGNIVKVPQLFNLAPGWNLLTLTIGGMPRTFLVFGDVTPPVETLSPFTPTSISVGNLANPFTVQLTVYDNSVGYSQIAPKITGLNKLPVLTRTGGSKYIVVKVTLKDPAGNTTTLSFDLTVTAGTSPM